MLTERPCLALVLAHAMLMMVMSQAADAAPPVEIVSHRGESADAPENTLAAFRLAWSRHVPAIELDVHLTKDGQLILCHDFDTDRTTGAKKKIVDSTLEDLRTLDAGKWKGEQFAGEKLPTLEEALATIPAGSRCFIEVKVGPEAVPALVKAVRSSGKSKEQLAIISFKAPTVAEAKKQLPEIPAYYLADFKQNKETGAWTPMVDELIATAKELKADGLDLSYKGPIDAAFVDKVKAAGLKMFVWTVDDLDVARRMVAAGVDGITTNRGGWLGEQLQAK